MAAKRIGKENQHFEKEAVAPRARRIKNDSVLIASRTVLHGKSLKPYTHHQQVGLIWGWGSLGEEISQAACEVLWNCPFFN